MHCFDPTTRLCDGCEITAEAENARAQACPAFRREFSDGGKPVVVVITPDEKLIVSCESARFTFTNLGMFDLRDAIEDGVRKIREADTPRHLGPDRRK